MTKKKTTGPYVHETPKTEDTEKERLLFILKDTDFKPGDLAELTEQIRLWLKSEEDNPLIIALPSGSIQVKSMRGVYARKAESIDLRVRLRKGNKTRAEARTVVLKKKNT